MNSLINMANINNINMWVKRSPDVCFTQLNHQEVVILNSKENLFYQLNESAIDIWLSLETPKTIKYLIDMLSNKYEGTFEQFREDVCSWLNISHEKGIIIMDEVG